MTPCAIVDFKTPEGFDLTGFWYGPKRAKRAVVFVHGLAGSALGRTERTISRLLADTSTSVLAFNNRGHDIVSKLYKDDPRSKRGYKRMVVGAAHEKFTDCADDIQGAIDFARKQGARNIFLAGHSTGCQKSIYWAYKNNSRGVKGIILLAPVSDYAGALKEYGAAKLAKVARYARALVKRGKPYEILPASLWSEEPDDAQRFLSLYTPNSVEEIFSYVQPKKNPRILQSVRTPILAFLAADDEFWDRPVDEIRSWFVAHLKGKDTVTVIPNVGHSFRGGEKQVAGAIRDFMRNLDSQ